MSTSERLNENKYPGYSSEEIEYQIEFGADPCPHCLSVTYPGLGENHSCKRSQDA